MKTTPGLRYRDLTGGFLNFSLRNQTVEDKGGTPLSSQRKTPDGKDAKTQLCEFWICISIDCSRIPSLFLHTNHILTLLCNNGVSPNYGYGLTNDIGATLVSTSTLPYILTHRSCYRNIWNLRFFFFFSFSLSLSAFTCKFYKVWKQDLVSLKEWHLRSTSLTKYSNVFIRTDVSRSTSLSLVVWRWGCLYDWIVIHQVISEILFRSLVNTSVSWGQILVLGTKTLSILFDKVK